MREQLDIQIEFIQKKLQNTRKYCDAQFSFIRTQYNMHIYGIYWDGHFLGRQLYEIM